MRQLKITIFDEERKIVTMGFEYPDYDSAREDFDTLCEVFGRLIDYQKILEDYQSLESTTRNDESGKL